MADGEIWLVTGAQASGKSTVADILARRFDRGVHVRGKVAYSQAFGPPEKRSTGRIDAVAPRVVARHL